MANLKHKFHPEIIREYDIRGTVGKTLFSDDAYAIGRAYGSMVIRAGGKTCALGYDGRISSPELKSALARGLQDSGVNVTLVGMGPTPMLYFAVWELELDAGIMVTGSHNPKDDNGFKMMLGRKAFFGENVRTIGRLAAEGDFENGRGSLEEVDIKPRYLERMMKDFIGDESTNVAWDAGNGAMGEVLEKISKKLPGSHHTLYTDVDGTFPNHHPDPTIPKNLVDLIALVKDKKCQMGIGFDGDGDRIGVVDDEGEIVWGDQMIAIYAQEVLKTYPGAKIIADVKSSQTLFDEIARLGGEPIIWKTGHSLIKDKMSVEKSPLAGEMSGHIFFADKFYGHDDALYCGIRLISIVNKTGKKLSDLRKALPSVVNTPEVRFEVEESRKFDIVKEVEQRLLEAGEEVSLIDGVRVNTPNGWWLLRASNTQNVLVVRAEAPSEDELEILKETIVDQLAKSQVTIPSFEV